MTEYSTILTDAGLAIMTNAALSGSSVDITHIAVGDGAGTHVQSMTALFNEVWRGGLVRLAASASDDTVLECETRIPPDQGGWTIREIGLFDAAGTLIAIGNLPESYKPLLASGSTKDMQLRMYIQHENASAVTIIIDPAIIYASQAFVNDRISEAFMVAANAQMQAADTIVQVDMERQERAKIEVTLQNNDHQFRSLNHLITQIGNRASRAILT